MSRYIDIWAYIILTALSFNFIDELGNHIEPGISLFVMSIIAALWFNLLNFKTLKHTYAACLNHKKLYLGIAFFVGINWICSIYAPNRADPFIFLAVCFITIPICGFINKFIQSKSKHSLLGIIILVICLIALHNYYQILGSKNIHSGVRLGIAAGICSYFYALLSSDLQLKAELSSTQLLAIRFWPLTLVLVPIAIHQGILTLKIHQFAILLLMSFLALIIPVYFNQQAIKKIGIMSYSTMVGFIPICTFIMYVFYSHNFKLANLILCLIVTTTIMFIKPNK